MINIKIELMVNDIQKYVFLGELESGLLNNKIVHYGYHINEEDENLREAIKKVAHFCEPTLIEQHTKLTELANKLYPDQEHIININTKK